MLKIGNVTLKSKLILAPLSGCSDLPFRTMCRMHGCEFAFYEMLDAHGLTYGHKRTLSMLESDKTDSPIGVQILGCDPDRVLDAIHIILDHSKPKIVDLNCGCPALKVLKKKCGAYLLKEPEKAGKIIKRLASSPALAKIPITVKVRAGWGKDHQNEGLLLSKIAQDNGAQGVFFHGRSCSQGYSGRVDYEFIKEAKKALKIPVIGSGDILSPQLAKDMLDKTGCDGILVARGAFGSPWIFEDIEKYLEDPAIGVSPASYEKVVKTAKKHLKLYKNWRTIGSLRTVRTQTNTGIVGTVPSGKKYRKDTAEKYYVGHLRKIAIWYSKNLPYSKRAREAISNANSFDEIIRILDRLKSDYDVKWLKR